MPRIWLIGSAAAAFLHFGFAAGPARSAEPVAAQEIASNEALKNIDEYVSSSMKAWGVAGLSVAIVKDGEVIFARGHGVRDVRTGEPVNEDTLFAIGSMTKPVTAVAAGRLIDNGVLHWNDLVVRHLPGFAVGDPYVTGALTVGDALSHRSGFDWSSDGLMISAGSRRELLESLPRLKPVYPFRGGYNYSNIMFIAGAEAAAAAGGVEWNKLVRDEVFRPLGMTSSGVTGEELSGSTNVASPHRNRGEGARPLPRGNLDLVGGAGAVHSSAADMARFVRMIADGGTAGGDEFLKPSTLADMLAPQADIGVQAYLRPFTNFHVAGLGWEIMDYKGYKVALHGGAIDGMLSQMAVVPGERLGVVVLTNTDGARYLPDAVVYTILDRFLGGEQTDWNKPLLARGLAMREVLYGTPDRTSGTRPTSPLEAYAGVYRSPLGAIQVASRDGKLRFKFGVLEGPLEHWHYDTFRGQFGTYSDRLVTFSFDHQGKPNGLTVEFIGNFARQSAGAR